MKKHVKYSRMVIALGLLVLLCSSSLATLQLDFTEDVARNRLQYYWAGDASSADQDGRIINPDPAITFDLSDVNKQAKVDPSPRSFHFGSDELYPNSASTRVRLWNMASETDGGFYTALAGYTNPALGTDVRSFGAISYLYVKDDPDIAVISQYQASDTTVLYPSPSASRSVVFTSVQPPRTDGKEIEIKQCIWQVDLPDGTREERLTTARTLTISTPSDSFDPGDRYTVRVKHKNLWDVVSADWSDAVLYTVGEGGVGVGVVSYDLVAAGLGLNQFSVPFDASIGGVDITSLSVLVGQINASGSAGNVTTLGWWDEAAQIDRGYTITYPGGTPTFTPVNGAGDPATEPMVAKRSYQVSVTSDVTVTFTAR